MSQEHLLYSSDPYRQYPSCSSARGCCLLRLQQYVCAYLMKLICGLSKWSCIVFLSVYVRTYVCLCPTLAVTEMLVNVLNIHSEDDDEEPTEPGGERGVRV